MIEYGQWLPDQADLQNPGLVDCKNVIPGPDGYKPFLGKASTGQSVTGTVLGAKRFDRSDTSRVIVVGTTSDLFVIAGGNVTASGLGLTVTADDIWSFEQFGAAVYATSKAGGSFYLTDIDTDTSFSAAPGTPPKGDALARIGDFLWYGNLVDIDSSDTFYRVRWSAFNNPQTTWGTDIALQSGYYDMPTRYGVVTGLSGGDPGLVFQKYAVHSVRPVGGAQAFHMEVINEERGCVSPASIVRVGNVSYWIAHDGFCRSDGANVELLSPARIWDWFRANSNMAYISRVQGAVDWANRCVVWAFYGDGQTSYSELMVYQWEHDRWSHVDLAVEWLVETTLDGSTLEEVSATYPDLDAMPLSLDSPVFHAQGRAFSAFDESGLQDLNGDALAASFETGDFQAIPRKRSFVTEVTPLVENTDANSAISIATREKPGGAVTYLDPVSENDFGICPVLADGRYFRVKHTIPAGASWNKATGLQFEAQPSGDV